MSQRETIVHLMSGAIAGTAGAVATCPLEVVKTRLQSSNPAFVNGGGGNIQNKQPRSLPNSIGQQQRFNFSTCASCQLRSAQILSVAQHVNQTHKLPAANPSSKIGIVQCLRLIIAKEGIRGLYLGLGPNLIGVAPSRAIYFGTYSQSKNTYNQAFPLIHDSPLIHIFSAATAGFVSCTATNPIWFVKTRLQLYNKNKKVTTREIVRDIYKKSGILGFYKGISASYLGISETIIHFVIYEATKKKLHEWSNNYSSHTLSDNNEKGTKDFLQFMVAGAFSKCFASTVAYPHEVARTRLREEGSKYNNLIQTLKTVAMEEKLKGLYRGFGTTIVRQIPNTAIMMTTYEIGVYLFDKYLPSNENNYVEESDNFSRLNAYHGSEEYEENYHFEISSDSDAPNNLLKN